MDGRQLEAHCACGASWFAYIRDDVDHDDVMAECRVCGERVVDVRDLGAHHAAGRDVEPG